MNYAKELIRIFDSAKDIDELISLSLYVRDQVNSSLFIYCYTVVITHRYDSDNIEVPQLYEIDPKKFFNKGTIIKVKEVGYVANERAKRDADQTKKPPVNSFLTVIFPQ